MIRISLDQAERLAVLVEELRTTNMKREFTGIVATHQTPLLEHTRIGKQWVVWLSYNQDRTEGIYLRLWANGRITREALTHDGAVGNVSTIKPENKTVSTINKRT